MVKNFLYFKTSIMKKLILLVSIFFVSITGFSQLYTVEASANAGYFLVNDVDYAQGHFSVNYGGQIDVDTLRKFSLYNIYEGKNLITSRYYDEVAGVSSWDELTKLFASLGVIRSNDVSVQDQVTPVLISQLNKKTGQTTLASAVEVEDTEITVALATGINNGSLIVISTIDGRVYVGKATDISGAPTIIIDTPINFAFDIGTVVNFGETELNVDGSRAVPQIFSARGTGGAIPVTLDITRIIFTMVTDSPVDLLKFGDLAILTNGLVLRRNDGIVSNIVNIKSNAAFANIAYDFTVYSATNPQQGVDGLVCRLTFAGQNKMGVAVRIAPDEDFELLIQDDLTGLLEFSAVIEGHVVDF